MYSHRQGGPGRWTYCHKSWLAFTLVGQWSVNKVLFSTDSFLTAPLSALVMMTFTVQPKASKLFQSLNQFWVKLCVMIVIHEMPRRLFEWSLCKWLLFYFYSYLKGLFEISTQVYCWINLNSLDLDTGWYSNVHARYNSHLCLVADLLHNTLAKMHSAYLGAGIITRKKKVPWKACCYLKTYSENISDHYFHYFPTVNFALFTGKLFAYQSVYQKEH